MNYFRYYPTTPYKFGEEGTEEIFRNIAIFVDILEEIQNSVSLYEDYYIQDGERPDQVSFKLYDDPTFHWTFFFINDKIKESGWPITNTKLLSCLQKQFTDTVITTRNNIGTIFSKGETVTGKSSGESGVILDRNLDLGQLVISGSRNFISGEDLQSQTGNTISIVGPGAPQYLVAHHYEDAEGNWVDIDPFIRPTDEAAVSLYDMYLEKNTNLRQIKVINPSQIIQVSDVFREVVKA